MEYKLDYDKIKKFTRSKDKYRFGRRAITYVLPLPTREPERAKFNNGFTPIVGGVIRKVQNKRLHDIDEDSVDELLELGQFKGEDSTELFKLYLNNQMNDLRNGTITSIKQLESIPFAENVSEVKGEIDYVRFVYDTLIADKGQEVLDILKDVEDSNLIMEIIDYLAPELENTTNGYSNIYRCHFPHLRDQFINDLKAITKNESFMLENIDKLFVHYTFVAMTQIILKTNKKVEFNRNKLEEVFYILQWEKGAKWRNSYKHGYATLLSELNNFFAHEHALNILGSNTFTTEKNMYYDDIKALLEKAGPAAEEQFVQSIYRWLVEEYELFTGVSVARYSSDKTLEAAFDDLLNAVSQGISQEIDSRYQRAYKAIVSQFFRKNGGSLGTLISLSQEQLLLLVAVSVNDSRIELKKLWMELEKRGVWLDHYSKEEVIRVLDKLNYLEKKSDSGDAQYVKSIL